MKSRGGARQLCLAFPLFTAVQKEDLAGVEANRKRVALCREAATLHKFLSIINLVVVSFKEKIISRLARQMCITLFKETLRFGGHGLIMWLGF